MKNIAVIIPCYNEELTIIKVIDWLHSVIPNAKIYVFDNNSTDKSVKLIQEKMKNASYLSCIKVPIQGKGYVLASAFAMLDADIYISIDADLQHNCDILPKALEHFLNNQLDMLNISRISQSHRKGHKFGNKILSIVAKLLFGKSVNDLLSGFRIFSRAFVKSFPATSKGFEIETELSIFALQCGMRIDEINAPCANRIDGSLPKLRTFRDGFKILAMIFGLLFTERPLFVFGIASAFAFVVAIILGIPLVLEFMETSKVPRFPTAFICVGFCISGVILSIAGYLAHLINSATREERRRTYVANKSCEGL